MTKPRKKPTRAAQPRRKLQRMPAGADKDELAAMAVAGEQLRTNPLARVLYLQMQANCIGPDPLAVGGCEWPDELTSGQVIHVAETEPRIRWAGEYGMTWPEFCRTYPKGVGCSALPAEDDVTTSSIVPTAIPSEEVTVPAASALPTDRLSSSRRNLGPRLHDAETARQGLRVGRDASPPVAHRLTRLNGARGRAVTRGQTVEPRR